MAELVEALKEVVSEHPGLTGREIAGYLHRRGFPNVTRTAVNQILYSVSSPCHRTEGPSGKPAWYIKNHVALPISTPRPRNISQSFQLDLYTWQRRALDKWQHDGYQGVIEAVTGTGKTRVAMAAMAAHLRQGWRVAVVVPSIALQDQWLKVIKKDVIGECGIPATIGLMGNGHSSSLASCNILISVAASAAKHWMLPDNGCRGLLIADECHHYGADTWSNALEDRFERRLGLTATYERSDSGIDEHLDPYFGGVCYSLGYKEALQEEVIADFKIAFVGVRFNLAELSTYEESDRRCRKLRQSLIQDYDVPGEPFGDFMQEVNTLAAGGEGQATILARSYLTYFSRRRQVLAGAVGKTRRLADLVPAIRAAERTIVFAQTKQAAESAIDTLERYRIRGAVLDASMDVDERKQVFAGFESGEHELVAAPMLLDEGVDVPSADLAIVLAASRSRRQMIQRMGRVLRKKKDARLARIVILFVEGTSEDPELGAHETFVDIIIDAASEIETFGWSRDADDICEYLNDWDLFVFD